MIEYINPFYDFGFKKLFGTEENKDLLISLLNAFLDDEGDPICDLTYRNVEQIGEIAGTRTNYFDVYCQTESGKEFIVEMQNKWMSHFKDRTLYYVARPIREQGKKGSLDEDTAVNNGKKGKKKDKEKSKQWDYNLKDVYLVAVMNFKFPRREYPKDSFFHVIKLMDVKDHRVFYDKLTLIYIEMPKVRDDLLDLGTMRDRWLCALNSLCYNDRKPEALVEPIFERLFQQALRANLTPEEDLEYERSMKQYLDSYNQIRSAHDQGHEEGHKEGLEAGLAKGKELGIAEGKELGLAEGEKKAKMETAKRMLKKGMSMDDIAELTGLTLDELKSEKP